MIIRRLGVMLLLTTLGAGGYGCYTIAGLEPLKFDDGDASSIDGAAPNPSEAGAASDGGGVDGQSLDAGRCVDGVVHDFCDDFEGVRTVQDSWTRNGVVNLAAIAIDGGAFIAELYPTDASPPPSPNVASLYYERPWPAKPSSRPKLTVAFRVRVEVCPYFYPGELFTIFLGGGGTKDPDTIAVQVTSMTEGGQCLIRIGELQISDAGVASTGFSGNIPINIGAWTNVNFEMPAWTNDGTGTTPPTANMTVNNVPAPYTLKSFVLSPTFSLYFGLSNSTAAVLHGRVALDDLRLDFKDR
jgi:hypothetical protein